MMVNNDRPHKTTSIKIKGGYSESVGLIDFNTALQVEDFDHRTRVILCNELYELLSCYFDEYNISYKDTDRKLSMEFCKRLLSDVFEKDLQSNINLVYHWRDFYKQYIKAVIYDDSYNVILDLLGYICNWLYENTIIKDKGIFSDFNTVFEKENVGYHFVNREIVQITDETEINEIEQACNSPYSGCKAHIEKSVKMLADRENKDYKNSIKESISAVESVCKVITGDESTTLGKAIKKLQEHGVELPSELVTAFSKLYGYTTDQGGIRHAEGLFESNVTYNDAKFMLVVCSAFVNYLIVLNAN